MQSAERRKNEVTLATAGRRMERPRIHWPDYRGRGHICRFTFCGLLSDAKAIGETIARRLAEEGVAIVGFGRSAEAGEGVAGRIRNDGGRAVFVQGDVSREEDVRRVVRQAVESFGRLDTVVNNAAPTDLVRARPGEVPVVDEPTDIFDKMMKVNVYGPFFLAKWAIPEMLRQQGGSFVSLSSINSTRVPRGMPGYVASKAALEALMRQIAADYGDQGVRANTIQVGAIRVADNEWLHEDPVQGSFRRNLGMVSRAGTPSEVAAAVAFLVSKEASFITAAILPVDGGALAKRHGPQIFEDARTAQA
jgi:NAD(P)-dependent dehydrogenase (short-subunit alcohol dehydrogenase family)